MKPPYQFTNETQQQFQERQRKQDRKIYTVLGVFVAVIVFAIISISSNKDNTSPTTSTIAHPPVIDANHTQEMEPIISDAKAEKLAKKEDKGTITDKESKQLAAWSKAKETEGINRIETFKQNQQQWGEEHLSAWDGSCHSVVSYVKEHMNNPSSFEHVETRFVVEDNDVLINMVYRGTNAFNAVVTEAVKAKVDLQGNLLSIKSVE